MTQPFAPISFRGFAPSPPVVSPVPLSLALILFWASVFACAVAHVAIVRSLLRASPRRIREVAWAIGPAFVLAAVLVITWRAMHITG